jgi:hypothetical protein
MSAITRKIQFAAALSLALMAQANLLMASFSPCGLPFGHEHFGIGHIDPAALEAHLAAEAACRMGIPPSHEHTAATDAYARVVSESQSDGITHTLDNLSVLIGFAALVSITVLLSAHTLSSRLAENRCAASPHPWQPPVPPPRLVKQSAVMS